MTTLNRARAFTIVEILVVVSIIAILAAFLLVALSGSQDAARTAKVNVKLKEIGSWMQLWSGDNDNRVLPSQFDFQDEAAQVSIPYRNNPGVDGYTQDDDDNPYDDISREQHQGTWADILWTDNNLVSTLGFQNFGYDKQDVEDVYGEGDALLGLWENDSPDVYPEDSFLYSLFGDYEHPFRSTYMNTRGDAKGQPGFFAANDFFDSRSDNDSDGETASSVDRYYTYAMIHAPARSVYLVDSIAGETISKEPDSWEAAINTGGGPVTQDLVPVGDIDFRYGDDCMMLMLDGSILRLAPWTERGPEASPTGTMDHTLYGRGYRVHQLTKRKPTP